MRKAPLFLALAVVGGFVAVDRASLRGVSEDVTHLVGRAVGEPAVAEAPVAARLEPEVEEVVVEVPEQPPAEEPEEMADDWAELAPEDEGETESADDEPATEEQDPDDAGGPSVLVSTARETWIYAEPRWRSRRLGYLRAGAKVTRAEGVATHQACRRGWYRVEPRGYVCLNKAATLDSQHPVAQLSARRPDMSGLPYTYVMSRFPTPPMYARLPSEKQQKRVEAERAYHMRKYTRLQRDPDFVSPPPSEPTPPLLAHGALIPALGGKRRGKSTVYLRRARVRSGFALLGIYERDGRQFGLTTEMAAIPIDRTRIVRPSTFHGVVLSDEFSLPVAIVRSRFARRYHTVEETNALAAGDRVPHRSILALTGKVRRRGEHYFYEARDGSYLRSDRVVKIDRFSKAPKWAKQGKRWIDVSILRQSLVAYEGTRPVFATLVSTGADGIKDHEDSHATIQGTFLIHTKHISVTMDGDDDGDEFDLRDVPFVQYFTEGYALHGAYWHDDFGTPRSHGCVNLAPLDAAWLFGWTTPEVPKGWHAALSLKRGTIVYIHP
jgi:hypothetical protein